LSEFFKQVFEHFEINSKKCQTEKIESFIKFLGLRYCDNEGKIKLKEGGRENTENYSESVNKDLENGIILDLVEILKNNEEFRKNYLNVRGAKGRMVKFLQLEEKLEGIFEDPDNNLNAYSLLKNGNDEIINILFVPW